MTESTMKAKFDDGTCKLCKYATWILKLNHVTRLERLRIQDQMRKSGLSKLEALFAYGNRIDGGHCTCMPPTMRNPRTAVETSVNIFGGDIAVKGRTHFEDITLIDFNHPRCSMYEEDSND